MKRLTLVISRMRSGGAERVMTTLANAWAASGDCIMLLTFDDGQEPPFFPLDPRVDHRPLDLMKPSRGPLDAARNNLRRIARLRHEIARSRPDAVLSFLDTENVLVLLATRGLGIPVVVEEHTDPAQKALAGGWVRLRAALYPRASRVVFLSEPARAYFSPAIQARSAIVPNPIVVDPPLPDDRPPRTRKTLIGLGRLGPEKGFDLLLEAFARVAPDVPDWDLVIWGDGALRGELEAQRDRLGLAGRACFPGRTAQPHAELRRADLFVMSSRREGFPMALGEAMACDLPAVSFDCESGPRQIIRHGVDGLLVPPEDPIALAATLRRVMLDADLRARLAARAPEVLDRFGLERVLAMWEPILGQNQNTQDRQSAMRAVAGRISAPPLVSAAAELTGSGQLDRDAESGRSG